MICSGMQRPVDDAVGQCHLRHLSGGTTQNVVDIVVNLLQVTEATEDETQQSRARKKTQDCVSQLELLATCKYRQASN